MKHWMMLRKPVSGWEVHALKRAFRRVTSGNGVIKNSAYSDPDVGLYQAYSASGPDIWLSSADYEGDGIVLSAVGARSGKCFFAKDKWSAIANTHVFLPGRDYCAHYLWYVLNNESFWLKGGAAQPYVQVSETFALNWAFPPLPTQRVIADFLDRKTAAIDGLIAKKERLIGLLEEKRAALINQAVTKGLDPGVEMKDSGVEWIGEIPAHWEIRRLKHISPHQTVGVVVNPSSYINDAGEVPFIYGGEVSEGFIDVSKARRITHSSNQTLAKSRLQSGDLVSVRVGDPGVTAVVPPELDGMNCGSIMIVRKAESFDSNWLCYVMNSKVGRQNVWLVAYGAAQKQFNIGHAVDFIYPVPPLDEQGEIVSRLKCEEGKVQSVMVLLLSQVKKLQEYRQSLITTAVTGQLDVEAMQAEEGRGEVEEVV